MSAAFQELRDIACIEPGEEVAAAIDAWIGRWVEGLGCANTVTDELLSLAPDKRGVEAALRSAEITKMAAAISERDGVVRREERRDVLQGTTTRLALVNVIRSTPRGQETSHA